MSFDGAASQHFSKIDLPQTHENTPVFSGFFVLRTPLLPFEELTRWSEGLSSCSAYQQGTSIDQAWHEDVTLLRTRLKSIINQPKVRRALFIASPDLEQSIEYWQNDPDSKKGLQTERALTRYFARMAGRATPFGLFSGCSIGFTQIDNGRRPNNRLKLSSESCYRSKSSVDFDYLLALGETLPSSLGITNQLTYYTNPTIYRVGDTWRYLEVQSLGSRRSHHLTTVDADIYVTAVIETARQGVTISEMATTLHSLDRSHLPLDEATSFILKLIDSGILLSQLTPFVTGQSPVDGIIEQLRRFAAASEAVKSLDIVSDLLSAADNEDLENGPKLYQNILGHFDSLPCRRERSCVFHVDLFKPLEENRLSTGIFSEVIRAIRYLGRSYGDQSKRTGRLERFQAAFISRYGRRWVSLVEALDPDIGIGFPIQPITGLDKAKLIESYDSDDDTCKLTTFQLMLLKKLTESQKDSDQIPEILLDESDFDNAHPSDQYSLPKAFSLLVSICAQSLDDLEEGRFRLYLAGGSGPSGAALLGRFCRLHPEIERCVRMHVSQEESICASDTVHAEIVHLPCTRGSGNVVSRPILREYEIPYGGRSGCDPDRQLPVADLLMTVENERTTVLFSQKLQKRIIPRLSCAHAFNDKRSAHVYQFLAALQYQQGRTVPRFDWGPLAEVAALPRVRIGRVVVAAARWRINRKERDKMVGQNRSRSFFVVQKFREAHRLPRWMLFLDPDGELPVDLDNPLSVDAFLHVLKRRDSGLLQEMYPPPNELCVQGPEGRFVNEFVIPFVFHERPQQKGSEPHQVLAPSIRPKIGDENSRVFLPGQQWLYFRVYGGHVALDRILIQSVRLVIHDLCASGTVSKWFFIRYSDPDNHLRIRFRLVEPNKVDAVVRAINEAFRPWVQQHLVWKIDISTYEREIERYGGIEGMAASEDVFFADSDAILTILADSDHYEDLDFRLRIALIGVDKLFDDCGVVLSERLAALRRAAGSLKKRLSLDDLQTKVRLGSAFRVQRGELERLLNPSEDQNVTFGKIVDNAFHRRSERICSSITTLRNLATAGRLSRSITELALQYTHMHMTRIMHSEFGYHELLVSDFLSRIYASRLARS